MPQVPDHALLLTDDEVVALACARSVAWPGGLPTVDDEDRSQLLAAAFRGDRSLLVRGLRRPDNPDSEAETLADAVIGSPARITVYLGDSTFARATWGLASSHYGGGDEWVLETISPVGIHRFDRQPVDDHLGYLGALLAGGVEAGPKPDQSAVVTAEGGPEWLCMLSESATTTTLVAARHGEVVLGPVEIVNGTLRLAGALAPADLASAVAHLQDRIEGAAGAGRQP